MYLPSGEYATLKTLDGSDIVCRLAGQCLLSPSVTQCELIKWRPIDFAMIDSDGAHNKADI